LQRLAENINISCMVNLGTEIHGREYTFCCDRGIVQVVKLTFRKEYRLKVNENPNFRCSMNHGIATGASFWALSSWEMWISTPEK
jgi:hypothetical protein